MSVDLKSLLGATYLTNYAQTVKGGVEPAFLNPAFTDKTCAENVDGDTVEWFERPNTRQVAATNAKGNPSRKVAKRDETQRTAKAVYAFEHLAHKASVLEQLKATDGKTQEKGADHVRWQAEEFNRRLTNLRKAAVMSALSLGALYFDGDGNMLPSSSGAVVTVDYRIPSTNRNQITDTSGTVIGASWLTAGTDIPLHVQRIINAGLQGAGVMLEEAYYGQNILGYISDNTKCKEWMKSHGVLTSALAANTIPDGFLGIKKWYPSSSWFFNDQNGTNQAMFGGDTITFCPSPSPSWYRMFNCQHIVANNASQVFADAMDALNALQGVYGMAQWASVTMDPPAILQYGADSFLPVFTVPSAVFIADVTP